MSDQPKINSKLGIGNTVKQSGSLIGGSLTTLGNFQNNSKRWPGQKVHTKQESERVIERLLSHEARKKDEIEKAREQK